MKKIDLCKTFKSLSTEFLKFVKYLTSKMSDRIDHNEWEWQDIKLRFDFFFPLILLLFVTTHHSQN